MIDMKKFAVSAALLAMVPSAVLAQSYYDDDIYYDADRAKKEQDEALRKRVQANYVPNQAVDYPGADTYTVNSGSTRDVDEYNRRNLPYAADTLRFNADGTETFACTRNIERFHNPDVVSGSADDDLQYLYYTEQQQPQTSVNIYVDGLYWNPYRYGYRSYWSVYDPWYSWSWGWGPYYDPYWNWGWGPSWSWSWGWGPGWYPGHCWGPGWGPAPAPGHGWGHRWHASSGASRPHYNYAGGGYRPSYGRRDGVSAARPAHGGQHMTGGKRPQPSSGTVSNPSGTFNPSYETRTGRRPGGYGTSTSGSSSGSRGNSYSTPSSGRRSNSYNTGGNSHRSSNPGYRQGSSGGSRSSGGSYGGGRSGGGHRSGGGGGRGRH